MRSSSVSGLVVGLALCLVGCGGGDDSSGLFPTGGDVAVDDAAATDTAPPDSAPTDSGTDAARTDTGAIEPEPPGDVAMDTIRVGSQVWERTLPMTSGQCFLFEDDGTIPTNGVAWGTLDGDDDLHFSAGMSQDGTFSAELDNNYDFYWVAGARGGRDDLTVELDFAAQTITGSGVFHNLTTGQLAEGSFAFQCTESQ